MTDLITSQDAAFDAEALVTTARTAFAGGKTRSLEWRSHQLDQMEAMLRENSDRFAEALRLDLGKPETEAWITEIGFTISDIDHNRSHMAEWAKARKVKIPIGLQPGTGRIVPEPKGVVLIIAPWNYPLQLLLAPVAAAITAGNAVVAKPSELAPATSKALVELCAQYLDQDAIQVVAGAVEESTALLEQRWDHIFFTGGTKVGKIVMRAAAEHLTPVTLELGGKSPAIVASDADIKVTANRIAWGKFLNAGQTCIAPDYVLVTEGQRDNLVDALRSALKKFYGSDPHKSNSYGRIINQDHFARLQRLMSGDGAGIVAIGGTSVASDKFIAPTVLLGSAPDSDVMSEEIFGPVLPILTVENVQAAVDFVNGRPKPLALYVFSNNDDTVDEVIANTSSGGVNVNGTVMHIGPPELPFGGVGESGIGAYHGEAGFETFSHMKSVYDKRVKPDLPVVYPPYTALKDRIIKAVQ